jgi:HK97 gp10 family phage protein
MADFSVTMNGVDALSKKLQGLQYDMSKKGGRFALRKAAQVVRDQARANALALNDPRTSNVIAKNITEKWGSKFNKSTGDLLFRIGVLGGARDYSAYGEITTGKDASGNPGGDTFYWRFVEFGTEKVRARPFMRPAMEQTVQKATDTFITEFNRALDRALKKAPK